MYLISRNILLILLENVVLIFSVLLLASAILRSTRRAATQAFALALPIFFVALGCYFAGGIHTASTLLLAASVSAMLFCNGAAILLGQAKPGVSPTLNAPAAVLILPMGIALLLGGFSVNSTAANLIAYALIGLLAIDLGREEPAPLPAASALVVRRFAAVLVGIIPAAVITLSSSHLMGRVPDLTPRLANETFAVIMLAPAITLPILRISADLSSGGNLSAAGRLNATVAAFALGVFLPLFTLADFGLKWTLQEYPVIGAAALTSLERLHPIFANFANLAKSWQDQQPLALAGLPAVSWRLDSPLLIASGFAMLGLRLSLLSPERWLGLLLTFLYAVYILLSIAQRLG